MEFTQYKCPVCQERFQNGDDIVVCPDCGAPHHRACYEENRHCYYADRHGAGFSFEKEQVAQDASGQENADVLTCPRCHAENEKTAFYCNSCGAPLSEDFNPQPGNANAQQNRGQGVPFGYGAGAPVFDPLVGLNSEDEIAPGVKVGEAAKYIGKNTPYYLLVFNKLKTMGSGKFNFSAFLFSGAFFLYRKMYALGIVLVLAMIGLTVGSAYFMMSSNYFENYNNLLGELQNGTRISLFSSEMMTLMLPALMSLARLIIMAVCGFTANRIYYKHCTKVITEVKKEEKTEDLSKVLEAKGGVNLPMGVSFFVTIVVIYEICNFIINRQTFWQ